MRGVEPWHQTPWDWRAAVQFICGGTGTGLLLFTALAAYLESGWPAWSVLPALAFVGLGLLSVFIKLGRRWRAAFVVRNPATSWMTREALLAPPVLGLGFLAAVLNSPALALAAAVFGLGFMYAQARILKEAKGIPIWREPLIVLLLLSTGLTEGAALLLIVAALLDGVGAWALAALVVLLLVRAGVWTIYHAKLARPGAAPIQSVDVLTRCNRLLAPIGHGVPLLAALVALVFPDGEIVMGLLAGCVALLGGWYLKFNLIARAAFNQGFALVRTPARTPGYAGPGVKPGWTAEAPVVKAASLDRSVDAGVAVAPPRLCGER
jgi:phenylacetyl-CoA:acceptor oxidoreductase subunit 2